MKHKCLTLFLLFHKCNFQDISEKLNNWLWITIGKEKGKIDCTVPEQYQCWWLLEAHQDKQDNQIKPTPGKR